MTDGHGCKMYRICVNCSQPIQSELKRLGLYNCFMLNYEASAKNNVLLEMLGADLVLKAFWKDPCQ